MASRSLPSSPSISLASQPPPGPVQLENGERSHKAIHDLEDGEITEAAKSTAQPQSESSRSSESNETKTPSTSTVDGDAPGLPPPSDPLDIPCALSDEELDYAKSIVLDLLGWGVQPEYLVECGVSSHAIYRIFTDLHLRLPSNISL